MKTLKNFISLRKGDMYFFCSNNIFFYLKDTDVRPSILIKMDEGYFLSKWSIVVREYNLCGWVISFLLSKDVETWCLLRCDGIELHSFDSKGGQRTIRFIIGLLVWYLLNDLLIEKNYLVLRKIKFGLRMNWYKELSLVRNFVEE